MKKLVILLLFLGLISSLAGIFPAFSQEIHFKASNRPSLLIEDDSPLVYKPTKLVIGQENKFFVKAKPGYYVSLATSYSNSGSPSFYGQKLRLGADMNTVEGIIPENGVLEMKLQIPKNKDLIDKTLYFEVAIWKNKDFSDIRLAKIIAPNGKESDSNAVQIAAAPGNTSLPSIGPMGAGGMDLMRTLDTINQIKSNKQENYDYNNDVFFQNQEPLELRNLRTQDSNNSTQNNQK